MPPVPATPAASAPEPKHLKFGVGFAMTLGSHSVRLEPESAELDQLLQGTVKYALPDDKDLHIGTLGDAWKDLQAFAPVLPDLPELTGALEGIEKIDVTLRELDVAFVSAELDRLRLNVELRTNWEVPMLKAVKVDSLMFLIDYQATS
jgi:hypothetical protein